MPSVVQCCTNFAAAQSFGAMLDPLDVISPNAAACQCPLLAIAPQPRTPRPVEQTSALPDVKLLGSRPPTRASEVKSGDRGRRKPVETPDRKPAVQGAVGRQAHIRIVNERRKKPNATPPRSAAAPTKDALDAALMAEVAFWPSRMSGRKAPAGEGG